MILNVHNKLFYNKKRERSTFFRKESEKQEFQMLDDRKPIASGTLLAFDEKSRYTVLEEVGRGASCIV